MTYWHDVLHNDVMRAHEQWLHRGRTGVGRLVLHNACLNEAHTSGQLYDHALFEACDFARATLAYASYRHADIRDCTFLGGSVYTSRFDHATLHNSRFDEADARGCWFNEATIEGCTFQEADLDMSNLVRAKVRGSSFRKARLSDTQLDHAVFDSCDLRDAALHDSARNTSFTDCDFRGANLDKLRLKDTRFVRCRLAGLIGTPVIEGAYEIVDPRFEDDAPFEVPHSADELRRAWGQ